jgi:hypothetical protein
MDIKGIAIVAAIFFGLMVFSSLWKRREGIVYTIRRVLFIECAYFCVALFLLRIGQPQVVAILAGLLGAVLVDARIPRRRRYIPTSVRRKRIAEYELRTGKKYNPRTHEIDHVVPFSKGGSHTEDNLEIVEKRRNRSKGARSPWWDLFG